MQECQDHHPAKDGDGWVEQTVQAFFFGIFQKVHTLIFPATLLFGPKSLHVPIRVAKFLEILGLPVG